AKFSYLLAPLAGALWLSLAVAASATQPQVVNAQLWDKNDGSQGITLSTDHVKPGEVVFNVKNISIDDEDHELLLAIADSPDALPIDESGARIEEDKLKGLKELGDVHPGKTRSTTLTLKAGKYMLFCNEAGHFKAGMYAAFTVAP
ncbi:MAG TPA: plastocyanin/azurin family copper-binding protein, partial [Chloroflexota bacterium]|nr:plastocyanin/azurin family copper-binding protein [Chloroflexota bacterium]